MLASLLGGAWILIAGATGALAGDDARRAGTAAGDTSARPVTSARTFLSPALRAEQDNDALNRAMLWVDQGMRLWTAPAGRAAKSCASCHGPVAAGMAGVAARYPAAGQGDGVVRNLEGRINACRSVHQQATPLAYESDDLLALTAVVAKQSRGRPVAVRVDGAAAGAFEAGRTWFHQRQGQLNVACVQCHVDQVGAKLRGDTISSGLGTGYPAYRLEWQTIGSLHRRLQACQIGVRASPIAAGSAAHIGLELYLAWRARGEPVETPGVRR